MSILPSEGGSD